MAKIKMTSRLVSTLTGRQEPPRPEPGHDTVTGPVAPEPPKPEPGHDTVAGGAGVEPHHPEPGHDTVSGGGGVEPPKPEPGHDTVPAPSAGGQTLSGGMGADDLKGADGADKITGGDGDDRLRGEAGNDTLQGGGGADTLSGGRGADLMTGGPGKDVFLLGDAIPKGVGDLDRIADFTHGEDRLVFGEHFAGTADNFATATADGYAGALAKANAKIAAGVVDFVAVQVGKDVIVFADSAHNDGGADTAVVLVGKTLSDVAYGDIG